MAIRSLTILRGVLTTRIYFRTRKHRVHEKKKDSLIVFQLRRSTKHLRDNSFPRPARSRERRPCSGPPLRSVAKTDQTPLLSAQASGGKQMTVYTMCVMHVTIIQLTTSRFVGYWSRSTQGTFVKTSERGVAFFSRLLLTSRVFIPREQRALSWSCKWKQISQRTFCNQIIELPFRMS